MTGPATRPWGALWAMLLGYFMTMIDWTAVSVANPSIMAGLEWFSLTPGPLPTKAMHARYRAIKVYLDEGINIVSDDLIWTRDWLVDLLQVFDGYEVWLVGVHVSDEEGARRETERGDRLTGANRGSARAAHADMEYDFEIDTTGIPLPELAQDLREKSQTCSQPAAFGHLHKRFAA